MIHEDIDLILLSIYFISANSTYNTELLIDQEIRNEAAVLILGRIFTGCLLLGPGLACNDTSIRAEGVIFGACPIPNGKCDNITIFTQPPIDHCINEPCMQHGTCISEPNSYKCHCSARYSGKNCEMDNGPPCAIKSPCENGGSCEELPKGDYRCYCLSGFFGRNCEQKMTQHPLCDKNPCVNDGVCRVQPNANTFDCDCPEGFIGSRCEINNDDCESDPCFNSGRCIDEVRGFVCDCIGTGYTGKLCQTNINECSSSPCLNDGQCFDTYGSYICDCKMGFGGVNCEIKMNECQSQPCQQGGTCIDYKGRFECICPIGYSGTYCEIAPPCPPCPSDSECIAGRCICKSGTTGTSFIYF